MRITNSSIARNYSNNLNRNLSRLNDANMGVASGRSFMTMAENTSKGVRSMTIRRNIEHLEGYMDNAKNAQNKFNGAEKSIAQVAEIGQSIYERFNYALNGTNSDEEHQIIATEFKRLQEELLTCANGQYADRYMFGGTNTDSRPFSTNDDGELMYNGVRVQDISRGDPQYDYLFKDAAYVDIGLGLTMQGNSQNVVANSAFKNTINGLDFMGNGSENLYDTITELVDFLEAGSLDPAKGGELLDKIRLAADHVNLERTKIGSDTEYLDFTVSRLETEYDNLVARQDTLEFRDPAEAIMDFKMQEYVYNAALQMGTKLLQPTLFNFIG